jgi:hypothetical protein
MWVSFKDEHFSAQTRIFFQPYINYQTLKKKSISEKVIIFSFILVKYNKDYDIELSQFL